MGPLLNLLTARVLQPVLKPLLRLVVGLMAVPIFRLIISKIFHNKQLDDELEKDLEEWFKASLILLVATKNVEMAIFPGLQETGAWDPIITGLRLMMIVGVIDLMPDQQLFSFIHPGPPEIKFDRKVGIRGTIKKYWKPYLKGMVCKYMNQSTPVFAILSGLFQGTTGWICYDMAVVQYLIIGLVTSQDKAREMLSEFDKQVAERRDRLVHEFHLEDEDGKAPEVKQEEDESISEETASETSKEGAETDRMVG